MTAPVSEWLNAIAAWCLEHPLAAAYLVGAVWTATGVGAHACAYPEQARRWLCRTARRLGVGPRTALAVLVLASTAAWPLAAATALASAARETVASFRTRSRKGRSDQEVS